MPSALVDVVIVNWNGRDQTPHAIDSVLESSEVAESPQSYPVTVADNGSSDGSVAHLRQRYGTRIRVIENGSNLGFGAGANRAIAVTNAPFVFLLNPDAAVHDRCIERLLTFARSHPQCAIAGPKILERDGRVAESCGEFDTWTGAFLRSSGWGDWAIFRKFANGAKLREWDYNSERRVDLVIGAAMLVRRSAIDAAGAFDEQYFMYHEEVDLAKRVAAAGYETWFVPEAVATHTGQGSSGASAGSDQSHRRNVERWKTHSRRLYWVKHHGRAWLWSLSAALIARYVVYACLLAAVAFGVMRLLR